MSHSPSPHPLPPVDAHVHIVGNGARGSKCWLHVTGWHRPLARVMLRHIRLNVALDSPEFDEAYVENLRAQLRASGLGAAVILAQEEVYDDNGCVRRDLGSFHVPNHYVLQLAERFPEFLPAVSIHPARVDALDELNRCLDAGAVMMKCLPNCQNIDCSRPTYRRFWERMAEAGLPLLAHTGGEHTVPVVRPELSNPRVLTLPLECGVTVIAAHCATKSGLTDRDYFPVLTQMIKRWPNLYADTSAFNTPLRGRHTRTCLQPALVERLVHGSDFPVPVMGVWSWLRGLVTSKDWRASTAISGVLERDFRLKQAMGFGPDHFTRIWSLLRRKQA